MIARKIPRIRVAAVALLLLAGLLQANPASAQVAPCIAPKNLPPADSPVLLRCMTLYAHPINETSIDTTTYDYYIKTPRPNSETRTWVPYDEDLIKADFWSLWKTTFLENLWIEVIDEPYPNGVAAKHVVFHIEERARVKAVDYIAKEGTKTSVDISKIEDKLREEKILVNLDNFVDEATIRKVNGVIRQIYSDKGYNDVRIETTRKPMPAGPKFIHLTFVIDQGPKYKLQDIIFDGNVAFTDAQLRNQMKENKPKAWWSFFTSGGTYLDAKFADDQAKVEEYYLNNGYVRAVVGLPTIETVRDSKDHRTRWIRLRVPIEEGKRYKVGSINILDNAVVKTEPLKTLFKLKEGEYYDYSKLKKGYEKVQGLYGKLGYYQFGASPVAVPRGFDPQTGQQVGDGDPPAIVDVNIQMSEGKQYFVHRITLTGNTTTHDAVARRELRLLEGGVFDSEALREGVRRLNQLGYFKPIEGKPEEIDIQPTPGAEGLVDVKLKVEEQNRNQISFGAGVSQFDGFFGQLNYQTTNFLGRGETFGVNLQKGSRARQYQLSFTEPYLFERPITAGIEVFARQFAYPFQFTQDSTGGTVLLGFPLARNLRFFGGYSYEEIRVFDINETYLSAAALAFNPILRDSLLLDTGGRRTVGKVTPTLVYNTVNQPIFPSAGKRITASVDVAGVGGESEFVRTRVEGIFYIPIRGRLSAGIRGEGQWIAPYGKTTALPIFEKLFLGGEYSIRGFDMRSIGPRDPFSGVVTGGNKTLTFNGELYVNIAGPVRLVFFYDAGQVKDIGEKFVWNEEITEVVTPDRGLLYDPFSSPILTAEPFTPSTRVLSRTPAFKTSTGVELRFFMPVLNVPFRLIVSMNPSRRGVLNNNLQVTKLFTFRFAVGTTF